MSYKHVITIIGGSQRKEYFVQLTCLFSFLNVINKSLNGIEFNDYNWLIVIVDSILSHTLVQYQDDVPCNTPHNRQGGVHYRQAHPWTSFSYQYIFKLIRMHKRNYLTTCTTITNKHAYSNIQLNDK